MAHDINDTVASTSSTTSPPSSTASDVRASAYGELGEIHSLLGNHDQALSCLEHKLRAARDDQDRRCEAEAAAAVGKVYAAIGKWDSALEYHALDLQVYYDHINTN